MLVLLSRRGIRTSRSRAARCVGKLRRWRPATAFGLPTQPAREGHPLPSPRARRANGRYAAWNALDRAPHRSLCRCDRYRLLREASLASPYQLLPCHLGGQPAWDTPRRAVPGNRPRFVHPSAWGPGRGCPLLEKRRETGPWLRATWLRSKRCGMKRLVRSYRRKSASPARPLPHCSGQSGSQLRVSG